MVWVQTYNNNNLDSTKMKKNAAFLNFNTYCQTKSPEYRVYRSELALEAVINSKIEYTGIDYELLVIYLKLILGDTELRKLGHGHLFPCKKQPDDSNSLLTRKKGKNRIGSFIQINQMRGLRFES